MNNSLYQCHKEVSGNDECKNKFLVLILKKKIGDNNDSDKSYCRTCDYSNVKLYKTTPKTLGNKLSGNATDEDFHSL